MERESDWEGSVELTGADKSNATDGMQALKRTEKARGVTLFAMSLFQQWMRHWLPASDFTGRPAVPVRRNVTREPALSRNDGKALFLRSRRHEVLLQRCSHQGITLAGNDIDAQRIGKLFDIVLNGRQDAHQHGGVQSDDGQRFLADVGGMMLVGHLAQQPRDPVRRVQDTRQRTLDALPGLVRLVKIDRLTDSIR